MSALTSLEYNEEEQYAWVGPGHDWGAVFSYLSQYDVTVAGGRLSPVGVPGLLLAGGVNFQGNQHGWAADNVIEYEIVLANGTVKYATACSDPDLFWALKGGSSNYGIVTNFKLNTFPSTKVMAGVYSVTDIPAFLEVSLLHNPIRDLQHSLTSVTRSRPPRTSPSTTPTLLPTSCPR